MDQRELVSVVIPILNERDSVLVLAERITQTFASMGLAHEIIFVDDGSTDQTVQVIHELHARDPRVGLIQFRRNFGKASALNAGFARARGSIIVSMDGDLQDEPEEIPKLLAKLDQGFDVVTGWKERRQDPFTRRAASWLFNGLVSVLCGVKQRDVNSGFKVFRAEAAKALGLYGELHRFVPVLLHWKGFSTTEVAVTHSKRRFGRSRYGFERVLRGLFDLLAVVMQTRFRSRPMHFFAAVGLLVGGLGLLMLGYLSALWFLGHAIGHRPLLFCGMLAVMVGVQLVSTGLISELINGERQQRTDPFLIRQEYATVLAWPLEVSDAKMVNRRS